MTSGGMTLLSRYRRQTTSERHTSTSGFTLDFRNIISSPRPILRRNASKTSSDGSASLYAVPKSGGRNSVSPTVNRKSMAAESPLLPRSAARKVSLLKRKCWTPLMPRRNTTERTGNATINIQENWLLRKAEDRGEFAFSEVLIILGLFLNFYLLSANSGWVEGWG